MGQSLPAPAGWFALALVSELAEGALLSRRLAGHDLVLFRGPDGRPVALDAHCPHMGAHMGQGGALREGTVVCPFHGFRFDATGACVATGYGTRPPPAARVACHATAESGGWVFVWFHPGGDAPTWHPPQVSLDGYTPVRCTVATLRTHPQETTENSVDLGHFPVVHGYGAVTLHHFEVDGPCLHTRYGFVRPDGFPGLGRNLQVEISVHVWGLGYSYVDVHLPGIDLHTRQYVLPTLTDPGTTELRLGMVLRRGESVDWRLRFLPRWLFDGAVAAQAQQAYVKDVMQDRRVWENKEHVERPLLAEGDGPIGRYRVWCRQFYPSVSA